MLRLPLQLRPQVAKPHLPPSHVAERVACCLIKISAHCWGLMTQVVTRSTGGLHPGNLTWNPKRSVLQWNLLFQRVILGFHVKFRGSRVNKTGGTSFGGRFCEFVFRRWFGGGEFWNLSFQRRSNPQTTRGIHKHVSLSSTEDVLPGLV